MVLMYSSVSITLFFVIKQGSYYFVQQDQQNIEKMARSLPVEFKMYYKVDFMTVIRGHHGYKSVWSPVMSRVLGCKRDVCAEAQEHDSNANVSIELSHLLKNFIEVKAENQLSARVTGKRKREVGLVVPAKFSALTSELRIARILKKELDARSTRYTHFELKNVVLKENKFPLLV